MKITDTELICDKYDETLELPQEIKITKFNQQDKLGRFLDNAKDVIDGRLKEMRVKERNPRAKWKIIVVSFHGHGFINYPAKESCVYFRSA